MDSNCSFLADGYSSCTWVNSETAIGTRMRRHQNGWPIAFIHSTFGCLQSLVGGLHYRPTEAAAAAVAAASR